MIGRRLSHFEIVAPIGAGGMGVVYKAQDLRLHRTVALKVLAAEAGGQPDQRESLLREARAASALNHPSIVTVYEVDSADGIDFIAMELIEGQSLDQLIPAGGLEPPVALGYALQVADALSHAHGAGVIHRDLKPRNLIVTRDGRVKVLDFGIAKRLGGGWDDSGGVSPTRSAAAASRAGVMVGTPGYMSPEQAQGLAVDARTDVFSFGVVLHEMLVGEPPFVGENLAQQVTAILRDTPPPLRELRPRVSTALARVVSRALEKDPALRYQRMVDLLADLQRAARPSPGRAPTRRALVALAITAVVVAVLVQLRPAASPRAPAQFRLLSTFPGSHRAPSLSPDGAMVAYIEVSRGVSQVYVKHLSGGEPVQVTAGDTAAGRPRWSPRGDLIVYEVRGRGLWAVPPLGGPPRQLREDGSCHNYFPDGERLVFDRGGELWTARLDGSEAARVDGVPENMYSFYIKHCAAVSPDGSQLAYFQPERGTSGDLWLVPSRGVTPRRLTSDLREASDAVFSRDGRHVFFSSARRGSRTIWRAALSGGDPEPITTGAGEDVEPDLSRDGRTLVYANLRNSYLLTVQGAAGSPRREVLERRLQINGARFSPDGRRLAFFASTEEGEHIFTIGADGTGLEQVTSGRGQANIMPRWSHDGAWISFYAEVPPAYRKVKARGGASVVVADGWRWDAEHAAVIDPSGQRVAYSMLQGSHPIATRVRDLARGSEVSVKPGLWNLDWSRDGTRLIGNDDEATIQDCRMDGSACRSLGQGRAPRWSADGGRIWFWRPGRALDDPSRTSQEVWSMNAGGGDARRFAVIESRHALSTPFDLSPGGEIAWVEFRRGKEELWAAEWPKP